MTSARIIALLFTVHTAIRSCRAIVLVDLQAAGLDVSAAAALDTITALAINLPHRQDRWAELVQSWESIRAVSVRRAQALPHRVRHNGTHSILVSGCARSHHAVVTQAFALNPSLPFVFVMEDDAVPMPDFNVAFADIFAYAVQHLNDWDIINLGASLVYRKGETPPSFQYFSHTLLQSSVWGGAHAMLVNRRAVPAYQRMLHSIREHDLHTPEGRSDVTLSRDSSLVTLLSVPAIVRQRRGWSDLISNWVDYGFMFDDADKWLLFVRDACERRDEGARRHWLDSTKINVSHYDLTWRTEQLPLC